jgi:hypothetical protein
MDEDREISWVAAAWPAERMSKDLMQQFSMMLQDEIESRLTQFIPPENQLRFRHGDRWHIHRADASEDAGMFKHLQSRHLVSDDDVVRNDLTKMAITIEEQATALTQQSVDLLLEKIDEAVTATGNVVPFAGSSSFASDYLEVLSRSRASVNNQGEVSPPNLYANQEMGAEIERRVAEQGRGFKLQVQEIMATKAAEAAKEERQRLSKYEGFVVEGE